MRAQRENFLLETQYNSFQQKNHILTLGNQQQQLVLVFTVALYDD